MRFTPAIARAVRAFAKAHIHSNPKIEGSTRYGLIDGVDEVNANCLLFDASEREEHDADLYDMVEWRDVKRTHYTPDANGEVRLDLYVYSRGAYGQLEDVLTVTFDADGVVSMRDYGRGRWERK